MQQLENEDRENRVQDNDRRVVKFSEDEFNSTTGILKNPIKQKEDSNMDLPDIPLSKNTKKLLKQYQDLGKID